MLKHWLMPLTCNPSIKDTEVGVLHESEAQMDYSMIICFITTSNKNRSHMHKQISIVTKALFFCLTLDLLLQVSHGIILTWSFFSII